MKTPFIVNQQPFFILGGQVHNSSGYSANLLDKAAKALTALGANTVEIPVYWEQVEPVEGTFSFQHLGDILSWSKQHDVRVVLLWFATWKNGSMQYAPEWVKNNPQRFTPVLNAAGRPVWVLSSHCQATWEADRKAFCALLEYLRQVDSEEHRVIAIQIENEPGILSCVRDYGLEAEKEYAGPVPGDLLAALHDSRNSPTWEAAFGSQAPEYFSAWSIARYIDGLAEAGKQVYDVPMYANAWLKENAWQLPGDSYPSGGPTSNVLDIWKCAAPHLDLIAPDIYIENPEMYHQVCAAYQRADNPLFVPESGQSISNASNLFNGIGKYHAIGYAMFGIESLFDAQGNLRAEVRQTVESFQCVATALPLIIQYHATSNIIPIAQGEFQHDQVLDLGAFWGMVRFASGDGPIFTDYDHRPYDTRQRGRGFIFKATEKEFFLVGSGYRLLLKDKVSDRLEFSKSNNHFDGPLTRYLRVEEGHFNPDGAWSVDRIRNGDEITSGLWMASDVGVVHAVLL